MRNTGDAASPSDTSAAKPYIVFVVALVVIFGGCALLRGNEQPDSGSAAPEDVDTDLDPEEQPPSNEADVSAADLGAEWPLTVPRGVLRCEGGAVTFTASGGTVYAINGTAMTRNAGADIHSIWRDSPDGLGLKINIGPLIDRGLDLC